jgi:AAA+ superfamily predicted ATPase
VAEYSAKYSYQGNKHQKRRRVFVWRESIGFEEYAIFTIGEDGKKKAVEVIPAGTSETNWGCAKVPNVVHSPEDDFPGATVPFAVEFMTDWNSKEAGRGAIFILRDWHRYIDANADHVDRQLSLFEQITALGQHKTIIVLAPCRWDSETIPVELNQHIYQMSFDMPDKSERLQILKNMQVGLATDSRWKLDDLGDDDMESVADATAGLTRMQMQNVTCMSLITKHTWDMNYILGEKKKLVEQAGFQMTRPRTGFEVIGGLTPLKRWATRLRKRFTKAAREYGFPRYPRGLLMAGVPGCGKSAISKALANEWGMNLLTVQATDLKGSLVGESEAKVHRLLSTARAAAPIIVFVDEAEKLLGKSEGVHDGGAHDAVLGQFLSFMQDDDSGVFFVFTANNMEKFAPELVDRFEGRFFIDLPSACEREEIIKIHLTLRQQELEKFDMDELVIATKDFSGRNIEDSIEEAMSISFDEDRELDMKDLAEVFSVVIPTSKTKKTEIETMRTFVESGMMRQANDLGDDSEAAETHIIGTRSFD